MLLKSLLSGKGKASQKNNAGTSAKKIVGFLFTINARSRAFPSLSH